MGARLSIVRRIASRIHAGVEVSKEQVSSLHKIPSGIRIWGLRKLLVFMSSISKGRKVENHDNT